MDIRQLNGSNATMSPQEDEEGGDMKTRSVVYLAMVYVFICVVGFIANAAVLVMIAKSRRSKAVTNIYIFNLALADLLYAICLPAAIYQMLKGQWTVGHMMCKLYFTCDGVSKFASVMFLVVLSFDRYMAVCHAIRCRSLRTANLAFLTTALAWAIVIVAMVPVFLHAQLLEVTDSVSDTFQCVIYWPPSTPPGANDANTSGTVPGIDYDNLDPILKQVNSSRSVHIGAPENETTDENPGGPPINYSRRIFTLYLFILSFLVPLAMVWIFYTMILHRLRAQRRRLHSNSIQTDSAPTGVTTADDEAPCVEECDQQGSSRFKRPMLHTIPPNVSAATQRRNRSTRRVTIMVLSIVICYTVCWIPYWFVQITVEFFSETVQPVFGYEVFATFSYIAYGMQSANSMLNPFLYAFGTQTHRRNFLIRYRRFLTIGCRWRFFGVGASPPRGHRESLIKSTDRCRADEASMMDSCVIRRQEMVVNPGGYRLQARHSDFHRKQVRSSLSVGESEISQANVFPYGKGDRINQAPFAYCLCCYCEGDEAPIQTPKRQFTKRSADGAGMLCVNREALAKEYRVDSDGE